MEEGGEEEEEEEDEGGGGGGEEEDVDIKSSITPSILIFYLTQNKLLILNCKILLLI